MTSDITAYIHAGWLIDGSGGPACKDVLLTIAGGRVASIDTFDRTSPPPARRLTDLSDCTLIPPLVDSHVHLALAGTSDPTVRTKQLTADAEYIRPLIAHNIRQAFNHGVLAVRDGGDAHGHVLRHVRDGGHADKVPVVV